MPTVSVYLSEDELLAVADSAMKNGVKIPVFIRRILREWINQHLKR